MELDPSSKKFKVSTSEPFGRLLVELLNRRSVDEQIVKVQQYVGGVLVDAYIDSKFSNLDAINPDNYERILDVDLAKDIAEKAEKNAIRNAIDIIFDEEHLGGIKKISDREVGDLPDLLKEREQVASALETGCFLESGKYIDREYLGLIDEEIEQARAATEVLIALSFLEERN